MKGAMNLDNCYLMGHSFGGATVLLTASKDDRFKAVVAIDPWMFPVKEHKFRDMGFKENIYRHKTTIKWQLTILRNNKYKKLTLLSGDTIPPGCVPKNRFLGKNSYLA